VTVLLDLVGIATRLDVVSRLAIDMVEQKDWIDLCQ
jgi:hypothetical protein